MCCKKQRKNEVIFEKFYATLGFTPEPVWHPNSSIRPYSADLCLWQSALMVLSAVAFKSSIYGEKSQT